MKFTKLMLAGLALGMMASCSQEEELTGGNTNTPEGEAYMSLSIQMPSSRGSRTINPGDMGTDAGSVEEQKVSDLTVYVWEKDEKNAPVVMFYDANQLTPEKPSPSWQGNTTVYKTPSFSVSKGQHKVVVVVNAGNPETTGSLFDKSKMVKPSFMREIMTLTEDQITAASTKNKFLMTNANTIISQDESGNNIPVTDYVIDANNHKFYTDGTVAIDVTGNKDNPTTVVVPVERVVAKIEDMTSNYSLDVTDRDGHPTGDKVHFTHVNLVNANTKFFPIKHVRAQHTNNVDASFTPDPYNDYIVDPNFSGQGKGTLTDFYAKTVNDTKYQKALNTQTRASYYTLENTMISSEQKDIYTTGLYYKAEYQLNGQERGINVYKFKGQLYTFEQLLKDPDLQLTPDGVEITDNSTIEEFAKLGVVKYDKGVCYYPYWIRHIKQDAHLAPMEFGVVRNNYYQMTLNSVKGIGSNVPVNPDPDKPNPDENADAMLDVAVKVLPWTVRKNDVDL